MEQNKPMIPQFHTDTPYRSGSVTVPPGPGLNEPNPSAGSPTAPTLGGLWNAFKRRWVSALLLGLAGAGLAVAGILFLFPARYIASSAVQIHSREPVFELSSGTSQDSPEFAIFKANMQALIKSPVVMLAAIHRLENKDPNLARQMSGSLDGLKNSLKTDFRQGPEIMQVTLSGDDPRETTIFLEALVEAFLQENRDKELDRREEKIRTLKANRSRAENELRQKKIALKTALELRKMKDPELLKILFQNSIKNLDDVRKELRQAQSLLARNQEELKTLAEKENSVLFAPISEALLDQELERSTEARAVTDELAKLLKDIQKVKDVAPNPQDLLGPYLDRKNVLLKRLDDLRIALQPKLEEKLRKDMKTQIRYDIEKTRENIRIAQNACTALEAEVAKAEAETDRYNPAKQHWSPEVQALMDEVSRTEIALTKLGERIAIIEAEPLPPARVTWWLRPEIPKAKDHTRQVRLAGVGGFGMFGLIVLGISLLEFRTYRINGPEEVSRNLGLNVVGTLPVVPQHLRRRTPEGEATGGIPEQYQLQLQEAVDTIRTMLLHAARTEHLHVVMITSALPGEGKTSLASQLAASLARAWRKTVLIDGDLRNPAAHALFGLPQEPGFSEVLRGEVNIQEALRPTPLSRLWLLPAGQWDTHALQALAQDNVKSLFENLKEQYDFIILDSSPLLPVADSMLMAQHVDGVVVSVLRDVSRAPAVMQAQQRLSGLNVRTLGAVVIGTPAGNLAATYGQPYGMPPRNRLPVKPPQG